MYLVKHQLQKRCLLFYYFGFISSIILIIMKHFLMNTKKQDTPQIVPWKSA